MSVRHDEISPNLFKTMGVPLLAGRDFNANDGLDSPLVVIVNQALVDLYFPGEPEKLEILDACKSGHTGFSAHNRVMVDAALKAPGVSQRKSLVLVD